MFSAMGFAIMRKGEKMDDLISRQVAMESFEDTTFTKNEILRRLSELPSAQPDIIVCADCKYWICHDRRCGYWNHGVKPLEWCCHAERRTDE